MVLATLRGNVVVILRVSRVYLSPHPFTPPHTHTHTLVIVSYFKVIEVIEKCEGIISGAKLADKSSEVMNILGMMSTH